MRSAGYQDFVVTLAFRDFDFRESQAASSLLTDRPDGDKVPHNCCGLIGDVDIDRSTSLPPTCAGNGQTTHEVYQSGTDSPMQGSTRVDVVCRQQQLGGDCARRRLLYGTSAVRQFWLKLKTLQLHSYRSGKRKA